MGRPPLEKKQRQLAVALPDHFRQQLETAAEASGHSIAEEIRRRLDRTLLEDAHDEAARDLAYAAVWMAEEISRQASAPWNSTRKGREALAAAIGAWLDISAPPISPAAENLFGPDDPATLGRSVARHFQRNVFETRKALQILRGERS